MKEKQAIPPKLPISTKDRFLGCLIGLAVGDAIGTTNENHPKGSFTPLIDMVGGGPFGLKPGEWTDDTSMALCLGASLVECNGFDPHDQMRKYTNWYTKGYMSSNGECFDIGVTVERSLQRFLKNGNPYAGYKNRSLAGNGCLMRLAPIPMFFLYQPEHLELMAVNSCLTTHGTKVCVDATRLLAIKIHQAISGNSNKFKILTNKGQKSFQGDPEIERIARGAYVILEEKQIQGTGYVIDSLQAALWCFAKTRNFKDAVLKAANLGDDSDTTAAICGQLAGAFYGIESIPKEWRQRLAKRELIETMSLNLYRASQKQMDNHHDR
jgi:ADP-ribosyl-[dinitrogen reductase] hydrolase